MKVIGHDDQGEPIWELTSEEYQQRKQDRTKAQEGSAEPNDSKAAGALDLQAMELGAEIWELRKQGFSVYEVHRRLSIPMAAVEQILSEFERQLYPDAGATIAQRLAIDD